MYKVVVSEFDGALINSEEAISSSTVMEIDRIRNNGSLFCVATDRCLKDVLDYNMDFSFIDYIICCSGAYLYDVSNDKIIYKKKIASVVLRKILNEFSDYDIYAVLDDRRCLVGEVSCDAIYKLEIVCPSRKILNEISNRFEELNLNINYWSKIINKTYSIEIIMDSVDKCFAIEKICKLRKISLDEVVYIGVLEKDKPVVKLAGCGVCMKNGDTSLKKCSDIVCPSNDEKGVKDVLNQLFN